MIWIDRRYVPAGYGWSSPPRTNSGSASAPSTPVSTSRTRPCCSRRTWTGPRSATRATGSPTSCAGPRRTASSSPETLRALPAAHRRRDPHRPLLRDRLRPRAARRRRGAQDREQAVRDYGEFNDSHEWKFRWMLRVQKLVPKLLRAHAAPGDQGDRQPPLREWSFGHYLRIAPPEFAGPGARAEPRARALRRRLGGGGRALRPRAETAAVRAQRLLPARRRGMGHRIGRGGFTIQAQDPPAAAASRSERGPRDSRWNGREQATAGPWCAPG